MVKEEGKGGVMTAASKRTEADIRDSIDALVSEAEAKARDAGQKGAGHSALSSGELEQYVKDLDLAISEEALIVLRAQFLRFSSVFDTDQSREVVRGAIADVMRPMLQRWLNEQMPLIAREVITEAISQIAEMRVESEKVQD